MLGPNPTTSGTAAIDAALERFTAPDGDPVALFRGLIDAIRPANGRDGAAATANWRALNATLAANDACRRAVGAKLLELLATRRLATFFTEIGILPPTGFFSELWRKIAHKILPELHNDHVLRDCLVLIFHRPKDALWFNAIPMEDKLAFWRSLDWPSTPNHDQQNAVREQLLEALLVVSHNTQALAFHPELRRVCPEVEERPSPFLSLHQELSRFADQFRARLADPAALPGAKPQVQKFLALCRVQLSHAYAGTLLRGVRLSLTYLLLRLEQNLDRIGLLHGMLNETFEKSVNAQLTEDVEGFLRNAVVGETQRNSVRKHFSALMGLLALNITENASHTGEHYITSDWSGYRAMWLSAMGAGFIVAFMALLKIYASELSLGPLSKGVLYSLDYGLGFVLIAVLHFTIATKQPAMTAAKIANEIHTSRGELREDEDLVSLIVDTLRSQLAAILGNVILALATATAIAWLYAAHYGHPVVDEHQAHYLLDQQDPLKGTLGYAAIAGVWLFVSGLVSGYFDNLATYTRLGERIGCLRWLCVLVGRQRAQRIGAYVDQNLGSIMGNFLFGCMLGMTGAIGLMLGLPIDIRHVTFSAANLAYGLAALDYDVPAGIIFKTSLGVALVGLTNLVVSFTLALYVALRSRGATFASVPSLATHVARRVFRHPLRLLVPPRGAVAKH